jgi:hypothetical protein
MSAREPASQPRRQPTQSARQVTLSPSALSMRDLLASCAAASAVSTPPREAGPTVRPSDEHRDATRRDAA